MISSDATSNTTNSSAMRASTVVTTPSRTDTFLDFFSFTNAYCAWHQALHFLHWLESNDYAVVLLAASNLRPLHFTAKGERFNSAPYPRYSTDTAAVHLTLHAPCCNTTVDLMEEERSTLVNVSRIFPFHASRNGSTAERENSATALVQATKVDRQHRIISHLLARAHRQHCAWRDRHTSDKVGSEADGLTVLCGRQLLLGGPSLCITESLTVRAFCAAVVLSPPSTAAASGATSRVRCLLPRGSPPSAVRKWMEVILSVLAPTASGVPCNAAAKSAPTLRFMECNVNERIVQLFFSSKKRPRPEDGVGATRAEVGESGVKLEYMALLMALYGYTVAASDVRCPTVEISDICEGNVEDAKTAAPLLNPSASPRQGAAVQSCPTSVTTADDEEGSRNTRTETLSRSQEVPLTNALKSLGWRLQCRFCGHGPVAAAIQESTTTTKITTITIKKKNPLGPAGSSVDCFSSADASGEESYSLAEEEAEGLKSCQGVKQMKESSQSSGDANHDVVGALAEIEATLFMPDHNQHGGQHSRQLDDNSLQLGGGSADDHSVDEVEKGVRSLGSSARDVDAGSTPSFYSSEGNTVRTEDEVRLSDNAGIQQEKSQEQNSEDMSSNNTRSLEEKVVVEHFEEASSQVDATGSPPTSSATVASGDAEDTVAAESGSPPKMYLAAKTSTVVEGVTRTVTNITMTFSQRSVLQKGQQLQQGQQRCNPASTGHHSNCPWHRLFLSDVVDSTALAAPERFMDFTWAVGEEDDNTNEERVAEISNNAPESISVSGEHRRGSDPDAANTMVHHGGQLSDEEGDVCKKLYKESRRTVLVLRFLLPEVERLITSWRLSEEWESTRPGDYMRHPLWRTWLTSQVLHPMHTENADGVMEQYLRTLEHQLSPSDGPSEESDKKTATGTTRDQRDGRRVVGDTSASTTGKAKRPALGTFEELGQRIGAPLYHGSATSFSRIVDNALRVTTYTPDSGAASSPMRDETGKGLKHSDAPSLLRSGLHLLLRGTSSSTPESAAAKSGGAGEGLCFSAENENTHKEEGTAEVRGFLEMMERRFADDGAGEGCADATQLRLALQREVIPAALYRFSTSLYPTLKSEPDDSIHTTTEPVFCVNGGYGTGSTAGAHILNDVDRARVMQYLQRMRQAAEEEQLELQRAKERDESAKQLAEAKRAAAPPPSRAAPVANPPTTKNTLDHGFVPQQQQQQRRQPQPQQQQQQREQQQQQREQQQQHAPQGSRAPKTLHNRIPVPHQKQHSPVPQTPTSNYEKQMMAQPNSSRRLGAPPVFHPEVVNKSGPIPQPFAFENALWGSPETFPGAYTGASPPSQMAPMHAPALDMRGANAVSPGFPQLEGQRSSRGAFNPSVNNNFFSAPNVTPGGGQDPFFLDGGLGGAAVGIPAFLDDVRDLFPTPNPYEWMPTPRGPAGGDNAGVLSGSVFPHPPDVTAPHGGVRGPPARALDPVLGILNTSHPSSGSGGAAEEVRIASWSSSSVFQEPGTGGGSGDGVLSQSLSLHQRESSGGGKRSVGSVPSTSGYGGASTPILAGPKVSTSTSQPVSASRGGAAHRGRGGAPNKPSSQPTPSTAQPPQRSKTGSSVLGGGGPNAHAPTTRGGGGGGGGGGGRPGQGRGRGGGGQRRGGGGRGGSASGGFRRGG